MDYKEKVIMDASDFVLLSDYVPGIVQEIRYFSTYNFVGDRIDGEWWHFTLEDEPFPETYFDFPVSTEYLRR